MTRCIIFAAGEYPEGVSAGDFADGFIIAADAGLIELQKLGGTPQLIIGDFDSLGFVPTGNEIIRLPEVKDDTDTIYAVREGLQRGFREFVIYGATGGRLEHTIANIQTLAFIRQHGAHGFLIGKNELVTVIKNERLNFSEQLSGFFSVFSLSDSASGVSITGAKYPLDGASLTNSFPLGVSNEFSGKQTLISVSDGTLYIIWQQKPGTALPVFMA